MAEDSVVNDCRMDRLSHQVYEKQIYHHTALPFIHHYSIFTTYVIFSKTVVVKVYNQQWHSGKKFRRFDWQHQVESRASWLMIPIINVHRAALIISLQYIHLKLSNSNPQTWLKLSCSATHSNKNSSHSEVFPNVFLSLSKSLFSPFQWKIRRSSQSLHITF